MSIPFTNGVRFVDKLLFTRHLSVMLKSGVTIAEAVSILAEQMKPGAFKTALTEIYTDILHGQPLYKSLAKYPHVYDPIYVNLIKIGEESGTLEKSLVYLSTHLQKHYELKKKIQSAMLYPSIVVTTIFFVGIGIMVFVLPNLINLFESLDVELPLTTKILLFMARISKDYGIFIVVGSFAFILSIYYLIQKTRLRYAWHRLLLSLPLLGQFFQYAELAGISRNVGTMLQSGLPITLTLEAQYGTTTNLVYKQLLLTVKEKANKGESLYSSIHALKSPYFSPLFTKMIGVGEETGTLDESFLYLGNFFEEEVDSIVKNLSSILEPVLLLVIGLMVAFVAFSVISPIYQLTGSIRK